METHTEYDYHDAKQHMVHENVPTTPHTHFTLRERGNVLPKIANITLV